MRPGTEGPASRALLDRYGPTVRVLKKLLAAVAVGFGMIFGSKAKDQHWSETTSVLVQEDRAEGDAGED